MTDADVCRANGWGPGTVLVFDTVRSAEAYRLLAVSDRAVTGRLVASRGLEDDDPPGWLMVFSEPTGVNLVGSAFRGVWRPARPGEIPGVDVPDPNPVPFPGGVAADPAAGASAHSGRKYLRRVVAADGSGATVLADVYAVLAAFGVTCPATAHAASQTRASGMGEDVWLAVLNDMRERRLVGIDRYGKPVSATDGREDWLRHAYEESLDLVVYLKAELLRRQGSVACASTPVAVAYGVADTLWCGQAVGGRSGGEQGQRGGVN